MHFIRIATVYFIWRQVRLTLPVHYILPGETALQLAGFAAARRETIGAPLPPLEQALVDRMIAPAREAVSEPHASVIRAAGCSFKLE